MRELWLGAARGWRERGLETNGSGIYGRGGALLRRRDRLRLEEHNMLFLPLGGEQHNVAGRALGFATGSDR
eukprot:1899121-Pyramimonas_sp.AAC.1